MDTKRISLNLIGKKLNERIMEYLIKEKGSVSEISRKINSPKNRVSEALREIEKFGFIKKQITGRTHTYYFNYFNPFAKEIFRFFLAKKVYNFNKKFNFLPLLFFEFLKRIFKNFSGLIFFGSCVSNDKYKDIDVILLFKKPADKEKAIKAVQIFETIFNIKFSFLTATKKEIEAGISSDMFFKNVINGIPIGCSDFVIDITFGPFEKKKEDALDRIITSLRDIERCRNDKEFASSYLEKSVFDIIYSFLHLREETAADDYEAIKKISGFLNKNEIKTIENLKKGEFIAKNKNNRANINSSSLSSQKQKCPNINVSDYNIRECSEVAKKLAVMIYE